MMDGPASTTSAGHQNNSGSTSTTSAQYQNNIGSTARVFWGGGGCINTLDAPQHQHSIYISAHLIVRRRSLVIAGLGFEAGVCAQVVLALHHADLIRQPDLREWSPVHVVFPRHPGKIGGLLQSLDP